LTVQQVADQLGISTARVGQLIKIHNKNGKGGLEAKRVGREWRIREQGLIDYLMNRVPQNHAGPGRGHKNPTTE
jgi:excisionase family DNA binding protein